MPTEQIEAIGRAPLSALDGLARAVWADYAAGKLAEAKATALIEAIEGRRAALRRPVVRLSALQVVVVQEGAERSPAGNVEPRRAARSGSRQLVLRIPRPATYDRAKSRERRRRLAYSGPMPASLAARFTPAEVAVLRVIADEHRDRGGCARSVDEIAARAGVCRRTVQNALRHAERLGLVMITERRQSANRNLPNIVRVVSREWLAWIERRGRGGCKTVHATEKVGFQEGLKGRDRCRFDTGKPLRSEFNRVAGALRHDR
jgi:hypothetical protein